MIFVKRNFGSLVVQLSLKTANSAVETAVKRLSPRAHLNFAEVIISKQEIIKIPTGNIKGFLVLLSTEKSKNVLETQNKNIGWLMSQFY